MLTGVVLAAAIVLVVAGGAKLGRPEGTARAIRNVGVTVGPVAVQALGLVEIVLGTVVIVWAPPVAVGLTGLFYAGFAGFAWLLLAKQGSAASCGCFGVAESPVHPLHVVLDLAVAAVLGAAAIWARPAPVVDAAVAVSLAACVLAAALILALTLLPRMLLTAAESLRAGDT